MVAIQHWATSLLAAVVVVAQANPDLPQALQADLAVVVVLKPLVALVVRGFLVKAMPVVLCRMLILAGQVAVAPVLLVAQQKRRVAPTAASVWISRVSWAKPKAPHG